MSSVNYGPKNDVNNYVPTKQRLGNKTLFTDSINGTTRYFSGTDAEIYFDEIYIDEVVQIQYQIQQNTLPLFGYNSFVYDQVAKGSRIINGSFTINFTQANYLYDVLNVLSEQTKSSKSSVIKDNEGTVNDFDDASKYAVNTSKSKIYMNDSRSPMWNKSFEIILSYGDNKKAKVANSTMLTLIGVVLTGCSQEFGINGDPVYETYTFVARDIASPVSMPKSQSTTTTTTNASTTEKKTEEPTITIKDLTYCEYLDTSGKPYGEIKLSYKSSCPLEEVRMQLLLDGFIYDVGMKKMVDNIAIDKNVITYTAPKAWREGIKKYCIKSAMDETLSDSFSLSPLTLFNGPSLTDGKNIPSSVNADLAFEYKSNGSTTSKIISSKMKLTTVYTEK